MELIFSGKRALVAGGSGGIGAAIAIKLAEAGAHVTVHGGSSQERLDKTLEIINKKGGRAEGFLCSANRPGAAQEIFSRAPDPDILICAWGPFLQKPLSNMEPLDWENIVRDNITFPGILVSLALNAMINNRWGRIILFGGTNTASIRGFSTSAAYSSAKTALGVLAKSVAQQAGPQGVTCNVICPGLVETEYTNKEMKHYISARSPGGRIQTPEDIAGFVMAVLAQDQLNGAIIPVDCGLSL